ncbi:MAG: phage holin family protein [Coriobacteriales bacterium]|jgi:hypothetical protein|nr:phage holin family protein [Coriobacteriales bacterium]
MFTVIIASDRARLLLEEYDSLFAPFKREGSLAICNWRNNQIEGGSFDEVLPGLRQLICGKDSWRAVIVGDEGKDSWQVFESNNEHNPYHGRTTRENPFDFAWDNRVAPPDVKETELPQVLVTHLLMGYPSAAPEFRRYISYDIYHDSLDGHVEAGLISQSQLAGIRVKIARRYPGFEQDSDRLRILFEDQQRSPIDELIKDYESRLALEKELIKQSPGPLPVDQILYALVDIQLQRHNGSEGFEKKEPRTPNDQQKLRQLQEQYKSGEMLPSEIICIQTRPAQSVRERDAKALWESRIEDERSNFVDRNNYPPETRFICYDMVPPNISSYNRCCFDYCLCVLAISLTQIPASYFQAYYLYSINVDVNTGELVDAYSNLYGVVEDVIESITQRLQAPPSLIFRANDLLTNTVIPVELDRLNLVSLKPQKTRVGLVRDIPRPGELVSWQSSATLVRRQIDRFDKLPKRILARSVATMHDHCDAFPADEYELDVFDIDELEAAAGSLRSELAEHQNSRAFDRAETGKKLDEADRRITGYIRTRMDASRAFTGLGIMALAVVLTLLPFVVDAVLRGGLYIVNGILVPLVVILCAAIGMFAALWASRRKLKNLLRQVKRMLQAVENQTSERLSVMGDFLGHIATLANIRNMLSEASDDGAQHRQRLRKLYSAQSRLKKHRDRIVDLLRSYGKEVIPISVRPTLLDIDNPDILFDLDLLELPPTRKKMNLNHSGERISAPYAFVSRLCIERSPIFEPNFENIEAAEQARFAARQAHLAVEAQKITAPEARPEGGDQ